MSTVFRVDTVHRNYLPNCVEQNIYEEGVTLSWDVPFCEKYLVVASLHQVLQHEREHKPITNVHARQFIEKS